MKLSKLILALLIAMTFTLVACKEEGAMEKAGKSMDKAAKDVQKEAEKVGKDVEDAVEDAKDG